MNPAVLAESESVLSILTSPAHIVAELVLMLVFDVLLGALALPFARRRFTAWRDRLHTEFDAAHGIEHDETALFVQDPLPFEPRSAVDEAFDSIVAAGLATSYTPPTRVVRA